MLKLDKYSFGVEAGAGQQTKAQLQAFLQLAQEGVEVTPIWNLSVREPSIAPAVFDAANAAVDELNWEQSWHVDADGVRLDNVDPFIPVADLFTFDLAPDIGQPAERKDVERFVIRHPELIGTHAIKGLSQPFVLRESELQRIVAKYVASVRAAVLLAKRIGKRRGRGKFIAEISLDAAPEPQTSAEILVLVSLLADFQVRVQTLAPKMATTSGQDASAFEREFNDHLAVLTHGVALYSVPKNLKLSIRLGPAQTAFYPIIRDAIGRTGVGLHVNVTGTRPEDLHSQHLRPIFAGSK